MASLWSKLTRFADDTSIIWIDDDLADDLAHVSNRAAQLVVIAGAVDDFDDPVVVLRRRRLAGDQQDASHFRQRALDHLARDDTDSDLAGWRRRPGDHLLVADEKSLAQSD